VDAEKLTLDAAMFADRYNLWDLQNKAKVIVDRMIGVTGDTNMATNVVNVYRRSSNTVHASPGN
jgi:hypothetical protein